MNKLVDQYSNTAHHFINEKDINCDYSASTENIKLNPKAPKFKVSVRVRTTKYKNIFSQGCTESVSQSVSQPARQPASQAASQPASQSVSQSAREGVSE